MNASAAGTVTPLYRGCGGDRETGDAVVPPGIGGPRAAIASLRAALVRGDDDPAVMALVIATSGSTYVKPGTVIALHASGRRTGWLSGGCLEATLEADARNAAHTGCATLIAYDTREEFDRWTGNGCRGLVQVLLLPLALLDGIEAMFDDWLAGAGALTWQAQPGTGVCARIGQRERVWPITGDAVAHDSEPWSVTIAPAPHVLVFGAGPESDLLLPALRQLGWQIELVERRPRWLSRATLADHHHASAPPTTASQIDLRRPCAALVMNHDFELDREALSVLAGSPVPWIGLLGPRARRDELLQLLGKNAANALSPRLHGPVGLKLGGTGPEAIAIAILAQLQQLTGSTNDPLPATPDTVAAV